MKLFDPKKMTLLMLALCALLLGFNLSRPAESARRYEYRVILVSGSTELRKQGDVQQGHVKTIENMVNQQALQGWELFQADGYVLYFRK